MQDFVYLLSDRLVVKPLANKSLVCESSMQQPFQLVIAFNPPKKPKCLRLYPVWFLCGVVAERVEATVNVCGGANFDGGPRTISKDEIDEVRARAGFKHGYGAPHGVCVHVPTPDSNGPLTCAG